MSEPKVIYLGPACEADTGDGRTWAEDNPWPDCECGHRAVQYVLGETFNRMKAERDALQLRLNVADQRIDELTQHELEPVNWAAPKTVRQLIRQLQTLDPDLETHAMLRIPDFKDGKQVRSCPLSISYERMEGPWLSSFKGEDRKVIAIWAKPDHRDLQDQGETLTESAES
ncbi:hypothetical protein [Pseudomonas sp. PDM10]|uniref:hypothetical protein n=1 Tax=Pseudomonas sp. PDM10 TaxID=2769269 RepID=UPI001CE0CD67|nr:hypothetical protein [Pseudomonas sp. PDM10]